MLRNIVAAAKFTRCFPPCGYPNVAAITTEQTLLSERTDRLRLVVAEATLRNNLPAIYDKLHIQAGRLGVLMGTQDLV